ncbi:VOC family protein [Yinghuangia sp. YIM S09857]|uniref:VOC family protein n=1 Tax=Yinghuangia sp. YIM S09857 TaxID=3436929 RepID=UPI003F52F0FE
MPTTTAVPSGLKTGHIGLNVTDLDRSADFYTKVFGLQVVSRDDAQGWVFLGDEGRLLITLWRQSEGVFRAGTPGLHHLSFQVDDVAAVRAAEAVLKELGAVFAHDGVVPHGEGTASGGIFFADPDGIRLEIYAPTGAEGVSAPSGDAPTCGFF